MSQHKNPAAVSMAAAFWPTLLRVVVISCLIGVIVGLIDGTVPDLVNNLIISNAFGISILLIAKAIMRVTVGRVGIVPALLIASVAGVLVGSKVAALFGAPDVVARWIGDPAHTWRYILMSALFVFVGTAYVFLSARGNAYRLELESERRRSAEASRAQAVAQLGLLQAQIEPHFLFNTLAHVHSAIDQDPALGKVMLEHLIRYLRGALQRSRTSSYTLNEERELIDALLAIAAIRLGKRLEYAVEFAPAARLAQLPPLLLQPLVENAIKHGIEPCIDGGSIRVSAELQGETLVLRVEDTGLGLGTAHPEGVGLANVRERIANLYGTQGRLSLARNQPSGTVAELRVPCATAGA